MTRRHNRIAAAGAALAVAAVVLVVRTGVEPRVLPPDVVLPDGSRYHGETRDGRFHGQGTLVRDGGERYRGAFADGRFNGLGRYTDADGDVYTGEFVDGRFHGLGSLQRSDGSARAGRWADDRLVIGRHRDPQGNVYRGRFADGAYHGPGTYTTAAGEVYRGTFREGRLQGRGVHTTPAGQRYVGAFRDGRYHGRGRLREPDGTLYVGGFRDGYRHGDGRVVVADGEVLRRGRWQWGEYRAADEDRRAAAVERALYAQDELLDRALDGVAAGRPGRIELYFVGVAPYGRQDVFRREIDAVAERLDRLYGTGERSVVLGNHPDTLATRPMATRRSIERALEGVAARMNPDEDILLLYVTSHGSRDHRLAIEQPGFELPDLGAERLAAMVDGLPSRWHVIGISACFSGGFVPDLAGDKRLVMTAARHDRTSFGCNDAAEMTYFGKAYFREALPAAETFRGAFERARELVREWEDEAGFDRHSRPQIALGDALAVHLARWRDQRDRLARAGLGGAGTDAVPD